MDKTLKRERYKRLVNAGLWNLADAMMTTIRRKLRAEKYANQNPDEETAGHDPDAVAKAWNEVWEQLSPLCTTIEQLQNALKDIRKERDHSCLAYQGDPDELVDPNYRETDDTARTKDAYSWLSKNVRRVVHDTEDGTNIDFDRAATKPPTIFAVQLLEQYAQAKPGSTQRRSLTDKITQVLGATTQHKKTSGIGYAGDL